MKTYKLLSRAEWWDSYHASHCPQGLPPPQHSEDVRKVFNVLLWHRDRVQGASPWALDMRFENSMQGAPRCRALAACLQACAACQRTAALLCGCAPFQTCGATLPSPCGQGGSSGRSAPQCAGGRCAWPSRTWRAACRRGSTPRRGTSARSAGSRWGTPNSMHEPEAVLGGQSSMRVGWVGGPRFKARCLPASLPAWRRAVPAGGGAAERALAAGRAAGGRHGERQGLRLLAYVSLPVHFGMLDYSALHHFCRRTGGMRGMGRRRCRQAGSTRGCTLRPTPGATPAAPFGRWGKSCWAVMGPRHCCTAPLVLPEFAPPTAAATLSLPLVQQPSGHAPTSTAGPRVLPPAPLAPGEHAAVEQGPAAAG